MIRSMRPALRFAVATLVLSLPGCIDPADRRPGLWLSGEIVEGEVADWSFSDAHQEVFIETRTPYLLRHSTTIACAADAGGLYVAARNPAGKRWVKNLERDPDVRIEIGDRIYERRLVRIADPDGERAAYRAYAAKYGWPASPAPGAPEVWYYRVTPRG